MRQPLQTAARPSEKLAASSYCKGITTLPAVLMKPDFPKEAIALQYERAVPFADGLAAVRKGGKWGFIDKTGKVVVSISYDTVGAFYESQTAVERVHVLILVGDHQLAGLVNKAVLPVLADGGQTLGKAGGVNRRLSFGDKVSRQSLILFEKERKNMKKNQDVRPHQRGDRKGQPGSHARGKLFKGPILEFLEFRKFDD